MRPGMKLHHRLPERRARRPGFPTAVLAGVAVLALASATACAPAAQEQPPASPRRSNLLLLTVDTLRPDALGWVSGGHPTPALDRLAAEGFRFPAAVSPVPLTLPAHISMMSGLVPRRHGVRDNGQLLGHGPELLAEMLRERGYTTAAFVSGYPLKGFFGLARGFDHYDDRLSAGEGAWLERPAPATTAAALAWAEHAASPWFLWVHYFDPHYPYSPPAALAPPGWRGSYDGEVAVVDRAVGELRRGLDRLSAGERLTIFAADHGESLGEHGEGTHGFFIYESTVRVPLVVHFPGRIAPGESAAGARLVDVAPTVVELLGLPPIADVDGVSLVPLLDGEPQTLPPAYCETVQPWTSYGWSPLRSIRHQGWKLIAAPRPELYHLTQDPAEAHNLVAQRVEKARELTATLGEIEALPAAGAAAMDDPETLAALRALGYVGSGSADGIPPAGASGRDLADPKDRTELREILTTADELLRRGEFRAALERFESALAAEPENRFAVARSGEALLRAGDLERALARLRKAAELSPERPEVHTLLAEALTRSGAYEAAIGEWREVVRLRPGEVRAWSRLGATLGMAGRAEEAVTAMARAAELAPGDPDPLTRLAFAEHGAGRIADAARHLEEAAELVGEARFFHSGALGLLLLRLGEREKARGYLARSRPEEGDFAAARLELAILELEAGEPESARRALGEALAAAPGLRGRAAADPRLAALLR